jgi:hypothetical protein
MGKPSNLYHGKKCQFLSSFPAAILHHPFERFQLLPDQWLSEPSPTAQKGSFLTTQPSFNQSSSR